MSAEAQFSRLNKPEDNKTSIKAKNKPKTVQKSPSKINENFDPIVKKKYLDL